MADRAGSTPTEVDASHPPSAQPAVVTGAIEAAAATAAE